MWRNIPWISAETCAFRAAQGIDVEPPISYFVTDCEMLTSDFQKLLSRPLSAPPHDADMTPPLCKGVEMPGSAEILASQKFWQVFNRESGAN